jgi:hypothetical protein
MTHELEDVERPTFTLDLDTPDVNIKPLHTMIRHKSEKVKLPDCYYKFEVEFYDTVKQCAEYIDKLQDTDLRIKYTKRLSKIFISRHKVNVMQLFRELVNLNMKGR